MFHPSENALPDDVAFQFRHRCDYGEHRLAHRRARIQRVLVGDEIDPEGAKLFEGEYELRNASGESIKPPHDDGVE